MACPRRIVFNDNDMAALKAIIGSGGEVRGALRVGQLLVQSDFPARTEKMLMLLGGKAMNRLAQLGLIDEIKISGGSVYRVNETGLFASRSAASGSITVISRGRQIQIDNPHARPVGKSIGGVVS